MYEITKEERATLVNGMVELFNEYEYGYTLTAIDRIIDEWCRNKGWIIRAFKNHPNYVDGKFLIAFDVDYVREIDKRVVDDFRDWIYYRVRDNAIDFPAEVKRLNTWSGFGDDKFNALYYELLTYKARLLDLEIANTVNSFFPEIKAREGQKTTRVVNKLLTYLNFHKHPDYNREFAKYADALTPLTIKRHTILSLNPIDYLTMSFGNSWSSCHTIDKNNKRGMPNGYEGQYSSGTMSYLLDGTSMVLYTVGAEYNGNDYFTQPKINRQMFHFGEDKLIQGRLYPQANDGDGEVYTQYRQVVQSIISECFAFPNLWIKKSELADNFTISLGTHYRDYCCFDDCNVSIPRDTENENPMTIGHSPICIECGKEHHREETINCCHSLFLTCEHCGCVIRRGNEIEIDGEYYCEDCVSYCEDCDNYYLNCNVEYISSVERYVCEHCRDHNYTRCEECDEYFPNDEIRVEYVDGRVRDLCNNCLDDFYFCEDCEEYFSARNVVEDEDTGKYYCRDCMNRRNMENEQEGE